MANGLVKVDFVLKFMWWWTCGEWAFMCACCLVCCPLIMCGMCIGMKSRMNRAIPLAELYMGERDKDGKMIHKNQVSDVEMKENAV